jgi:DNA-binding transcriptional MerR regulator
MENVVHIGEAARRLGVTVGYLRLLEKQGRIPPARRGSNGRIYSDFDLALLRVLGVGTRPKKLRQAQEVIRGAS